MRMLGIISLALLTSCGHVALSGSAADSVAPCTLFEECATGGGDHDEAVTIALGAAVVGALGVALYRFVLRDVSVVGALAPSP
jgi:hypothetical protein